MYSEYVDERKQVNRSKSYLRINFVAKLNDLGRPYDLGFLNFGWL